MAKIVRPLSDSFLKRLKFHIDKSKKYYDGGGLFIELRASGTKKWRLDFTKPNGKRSVMTLGDYPTLTLAAARSMREAVKEQLSQGLNPIVERQLKIDERKIKTENTFAVLAEEYLEFRRPSWGESYYRRMGNAVRNNAYAYIGNMPITRVTGKLVLDIVRRVEDRGALDMADRVFDVISMVFKYAAATGRVTIDVTYGLRQFLADKPPVQHYPHVSEAAIPQLLMAMENHSARLETLKAMYLMARTFPRTNELVYARWEEFDLEEGVWRIPSQRMKGRLLVKQYGNDHLIPLFRQVCEMLIKLKTINGRFQFVFPGVRNPRTAPINLETVNKALHTLGFKGQQTGHGFRRLFSTIANESGLFRKEAIEAQLSHKPDNKVEAAYNHAQYWDERRCLMQWWSDYLDLRRAEIV